MIRAKELSQLYAHKHPDGSSLSKKYGENIQCSMSESFSSEDAETVWMNSTGHRKNILTAKYTHIGVGVYVENNTVYCVQVFENKNSSSSSASSTSSMSDEEFQSWAKAESGWTDEEIAAGNIKFYRPGEGTFKVNYND